LTIRHLDITPLYLYFPIAFYLLVASYKADLKFQLVRAYSQAIFANFLSSRELTTQQEKATPTAHDTPIPSHYVGSVEQQTFCIPGS